MDQLRADDGTLLRLHRWPVPEAAADETPIPVRGTVQIVHGLGEHMGRYGALAVALNAAGWHVAGHDQRGHGRSEGRRGAIPSMRSLLTDLTAVTDHLRGCGPHVLLGHSMGGVVAARFVAEALMGRPGRWAREVDGLVLSSPALDLGLPLWRRALLRLLKRLAPGLPLPNGLSPDWLSRDPEVVQRYRDDPFVHGRITPRLARFMVEAGRVVRAGAPRWRTPTLLLWSGADRCVRADGSAAFAAAAPPEVVTAHEFPDLFHEIFNEPERDAVLQHLTRWLARF